MGGLDIVTPALMLSPGRVISANNYEASVNGYRRVDGFERFNGKPKPSLASYWSVPFQAGTYTYVAGNVVTGLSSGASGTVLVGASGATGTVILTGVTGSFIVGEALRVSGITRGIVAGTVYERGAGDDAADVAYHQAAIEAARANIGPVPGSGPVRGVWSYKGERYAFRDSADGLSGQMFKATAAGWVLQTFGRTLNFTAGISEIFEGVVITGATSGATATVRRVIKRSGSWGSTAAGVLVLSGQTGTFVAAETIKVGAVNSATATANSTAITLPPGGRYRFVNHNFYGASDLKRMYFCNGVGRAQEWDGTVLAPVITGMAVDTPTHIAAHKNHLFLGFPGGSLQNSSIAQPLIWSAVSGAAEIGLGEDITGLVPDYLDTLVVLGRNRVAALYGSSSSDWDLRTIGADAGAIEWTEQKIKTPVYFDDGGLRDLAATQAYGDFAMGSLSEDVRPLIVTKRKSDIRPVASLRVRSKDQYRVFFGDGTGLSVYLGKKRPEIMPFDLGGLVVTCTASSEDEAGDEILLAGDADGWVYELDAGTSFDGSVVNAFIRLPFNSLGAPTVNKRYHKAVLEIEATADTTIGVIPEFSYVDQQQPSATAQSFSVQGGGGFWDEMLWNRFYWSAAVKGLAEAYIDGEGRNISLTILSSAIYEQPHVLQALTLHYTPRSLAR